MPPPLQTALRAPCHWFRVEGLRFFWLALTLVKEMAPLAVLAVAVSFEVEADFGLVVLGELRFVPEFDRAVGKSALVLGARLPTVRRGRIPARTSSDISEWDASYLCLVLDPKVEGCVCDLGVSGCGCTHALGGSQIQSMYNTIIRPSIPSHKRKHLLNGARAINITTHPVTLNIISKGQFEVEITFLLGAIRPMPLSVPTDLIVLEPPFKTAPISEE